MAVNSQINISINTTNAIKSIADLDNEIGGVVRTVTDLEMTISSLSEELRATEIGTERFKELQSALIEAQGHMKDFELSVEALDADQRASEFGSFAAGLSEIATGAFAVTQAFGLADESSEKFVETIVGGFAIANTFRGGLEGIISAQKLLKNSTLATKTATEGGSLSMKVFNAVTKANPIGILVTALLAGVAAFALFNASTSESVAELERAKKAVEDFDNAQARSAERSRLQSEIQVIQNQSALRDLEDRYKREEITLKEFQSEKVKLAKQDIKLQLDTLKAAIKASQDRTVALERLRDAEEIGSDERAQAQLDVLDQIRATKVAENDLLIFKEKARAFEKDFNRGLRDEREEADKANKKEVKSTTKIVEKKRELVDVEKELLRIDKEQEEERQKELTQELEFAEKQNTIRLTALNKALKTELDANKGNEEEQKKIREEYNNLAIQSEIDKTKKLILIRQAYGEDVEDLLLKLSELELGLNSDVTEKTEQSFEELFANVLSIAGAVIGQIQSLSNAIGDNIRQQEENARQQREVGYEQEQASLENMLNSGLLSREEYESKLTDLNTKREMEERAARRRSFQEQKKMNIANAIMAGAQAVLSGLATQPLLPLGVIMAGIAAATSAIQISTIRSTKFTAAQGGIVPGTGPSNIDSVPSLLAPGEAVINANSTSMFGGLLSEINQMGGGKSLTPNIPMKSTTGGGKPVYEQNQKEQRVYVLENDITRSQRRVTRIEDISRF